MLKAVFMDYSGTITVEQCRPVFEFVRRVSEHSALKDPREVAGYWWKLITQLEEESNRGPYRTEDEIADAALRKMAQDIALTEDLEDLRGLCVEYWSKAPIFPDVKGFFAECPYPIYLVTNNGVQYVNAAMADNDLHPAGVICGDMVKAYKPRKEPFLKALEVSGCQPEETVHIGDSVKTDLKGALSAGIRPILLNRSGSPVETDGSFDVVHSLSEVPALLETYGKDLH